jgi:hypothetical protein
MDKILHFLATNSHKSIKYKHNFRSDQILFVIYCPNWSIKSYPGGRRLHHHHLADQHPELPRRRHFSRIQLRSGTAKQYVRMWDN